MCETALPERLRDPAAWKGTDWDNPLQRWLIPFKLKHMVFGYRDNHWWHRWRKMPMVLLALFGKGESRWENDVMAIRSLNSPIVMFQPSSNGFYLSRIQYWCDWSIQFQWPLFFALHFKYGKTGVFYVQVGASRDGDGVYWFPGLFIGLTWK